MNILGTVQTNNSLYATCPRCNIRLPHKIIKRFNGNENIEGLQHAHIECVNCKYNFNYWFCEPKALEKIYGKDHSYT